MIPWISCEFPEAEIGFIFHAEIPGLGEFSAERTSLELH